MIWRLLQTFFDRSVSVVFVTALFFCGNAAAETITVRSQTSGLELTGKFIGYDGTYLQIQSDHGPVSLNFDQVVCSGAVCPDTDNYVPHLRFSGSPRIAETVIPALIEGFARSNGMLSTHIDLNPLENKILVTRNGNPAADVSIFANETATGFLDLVNHDADIVMAMRPVTVAENNAAIDAGIGSLRAIGRNRIIGLDGLVPVASARRDLQKLTIEQLGQILRGEVTNWEELDESEGAIAVHLGPMNEGGVQALLDLFDASQETSADINFHKSQKEVSLAVSRDVNGIGIVSMQEIFPAQAVGMVDGCEFRMTPSPNNLQTNDYPLTFPLYLYSPERRQPRLVRDFLNWLETPQAQLVVRRSGYIDNGIVPIALDAQGQRFVNAIEQIESDIQVSELKRFISLIDDLARHSISFRFDLESGNLNTQSRSDLVRLASAIRSGSYANRSLVFVGFHGGADDADRTESIHSKLVEILGSDIPENVNFQIESFGETMPLACGDTKIGAKLTQRVELWVSD